MEGDCGTVPSSPRRRTPTVFQSLRLESRVCFFLFPFLYLSFQKFHSVLLLSSPLPIILPLSPYPSYVHPPPYYRHGTHSSNHPPCFPLCSCLPLSILPPLLLLLERLLQDLSQFPRLEKRRHNIAPAHKLPSHEELGYRGPLPKEMEVVMGRTEERKRSET